MHKRVKCQNLYNILVSILKQLTPAKKLFIDLPVFLAKNKVPLVNWECSRRKLLWHTKNKKLKFYYTLEISKFELL